MKTYYTHMHMARIARYLVANSKPFNFDGFRIEFTATPDFVEDMKSDDSIISTIHFKSEE